MKHVQSRYNSISYHNEQKKILYAGETADLAKVTHDINIPTSLSMIATATVS